MKIIGLAGPATAGKDTVAGFALEWCETHGVAADHFIFADPLKVSAARALGFTGTPADAIEFCNDLKQPGIEIHLHGPNGSELGPSRINQKLVSGREFLQLYGTEAHREIFGDDFWVKIMEDRLAEATGTIEVAFLSAIRFPNEQEMVYRHEGEIWHIARPDAAAVEAHATEAGLAATERDIAINNAGTLDSLRATIHSVCEDRLEAVA